MVDCDSDRTVVNTSLSVPCSANSHPTTESAFNMSRNSHDDQEFTDVNTVLRAAVKPLTAVSINVAFKFGFSGTRLGFGHFSAVHQSVWNAEYVAIKKFSQRESIYVYDRETLIHLLDHANVVKIILIEHGMGDVYIVMEKATANLERYCHQLMPKFAFEGKRIPSDFETLSQMSDGLDYLHSKHLVHRSINPYNVLVFVSDKAGSTYVTFKLSDFGICRPSNEDASVYGQCVDSSPSLSPLMIYPPESVKLFNGHNDTVNGGDWRLPRPFGKPSGDVYSLGFTFFYYLTGGRHYPFSRNIECSQREVTENILSNTKFMTHLDKGRDIFQSLLEEMIERNPKKRLRIREVKEKLRLLQQSVFN